MFFSTLNLVFPGPNPPWNQTFDITPSDPTENFIVYFDVTFTLSTLQIETVARGAIIGCKLSDLATLGITVTGPLA